MSDSNNKPNIMITVWILPSEGIKKSSPPFVRHVSGRLMEINEFLYQFNTINYSVINLLVARWSYLCGLRTFLWSFFFGRWRQAVVPSAWLLL